MSGRAAPEGPATSDVDARLPERRIGQRLKTLWVILPMVALDQASKFAAMHFLEGKGPISVVQGYFELSFARNPGAFFSLGADLDPLVRRVVFIGFTVVAVALMVRLLVTLKVLRGPLRWGLLFLLGGALGNLLDRLMYGEVIDFLHIHLRNTLDWATFNVADALIVVGLLFLVIDMFPQRNTTRPEPPAPEAST